MQVKNLSQMNGGWFVGNFEPTCLALAECEVAVKRYAAGETEPRHVHLIAVELTLVLSGRVMLNNTELGPGDIACLSPGEPASFSAIEDAVTVVVKSPSAPSDKHLA